MIKYKSKAKREVAKISRIAEMHIWTTFDVVAIFNARDFIVEQGKKFEGDFNFGSDEFTNWFNLKCDIETVCGFLNKTEEKIHASKKVNQKANRRR